ncbi:MAG TPA: peptidoglycan-binding domain-containing protein [Stellaceae bacterium]|nr:peptidoglycan-binding domain-containing protein [Stellaceae bacterium]
MRHNIMGGGAVLALALAGVVGAWPGPGEALAATKAAAASATEAKVRADELRSAQRTLKQQGLYKGKVDGRSGPQTIAAIEAFQRKNGLKQTGWLDQPTWNALGPHGSGPHASK